jgi:hypothetical protein
MMKYRNKPFIPVGREFPRDRRADSQSALSSNSSSSSRGSGGPGSARASERVWRRARWTSRDSRVVHAHLQNGAWWLRPLHSQCAMHCSLHPTPLRACEPNRQALSRQKAESRVTKKEFSLSSLDLHRAYVTKPNVEENVSAVSRARLGLSSE